MSYLAVFDWNGTLFDDSLATLAATNACLASFNIPPVDLPSLQENFSFPLIHFYERMGVPVDEFLRRAEEESFIFLNCYEKESTECSLMAGAVELVDWLNEKNIHCMILSNYIQDRLATDVQRLGLYDKMRHVSGNAEQATIAHGLSKQMRLEKHMETHGYVPEKTFIIGDSHEEPDIARRLGLLGFSIAGGMLSTRRLEQYKADYIIQTLDEVRPLLENHWNL